MAVTEQQNRHIAIPKIICPNCGAQMSLAGIEPEGPDNRDRMFFDCVCGFEYRLSDPAGKGRLIARASSRI